MKNKDEKNLVAKSKNLASTMSGRYSRADPSRSSQRSRYDEPTGEDEFNSRTSYQLQNSGSGSSAEDYQPQEEDAGIFRRNSSDSEGSEGSEDIDMSLSELLYSVSSFYAIVVPGKENYARNLLRELFLALIGASKDRIYCLLTIVFFPSQSQSQ